MLVLDVGGGTSDLSVVTYQKNKKWTLDTSVLVPVSSNELGGSYVDQAIESDIKERLDYVTNLEDGWTSEIVAQTICQGHKYFEAKTRPRALRIAIPGAGANPVFLGTQKHDGLLIDHQNLCIHESVFGRYLDQQLFGPGGQEGRSGGIIGQAITMRDDMFVREPDRSEPYRKEHGLEKYAQLEPDAIGAVIFTGGVCNSAYVRQRITAALNTNSDELRHIGIDKVLHGTAFLQPDNGQTCVCRGLVYSRMKELKHKEPSLLRTLFGRRNH